MPNIPVDEAQIVALFVESVLYGVFLVTFGMTIRVLLFNRADSSIIRSGRQYYFFLAVAFAFLVVATFDEAMVLRHVLDAFVYYKGPGGPIGEFLIISYWVNVMKTVDYCIMTSIGDAVLIYRCFIVWGKNWFIMVGLGILWVAFLVVAVIDWYIEFTMHSSALLSASNLRPFVHAVQSITLCINVIATSLIVYKIYQVQKNNASISIHGGSSSSGLKRAMRIIVESGALYTASVIVFFGVYLASSNAQYVAADAVSVMLWGARLMLIIVSRSNKLL
ncbi:hypothetical protein K488DRAFT_65467 [Vararia minispora EC-137]|uniref:Uncharacterized protein n=1 Tax=Vararia minispora EC-137 TaxID=1314806 RepID=A0ACB8Q4J2_9AGAM|nr:hypothetical protein K488DRAFT_65467 [Vararia minispora EC-137]